MGDIARLEHVSVKYGRTWALRDVTVILPTGAVGLLSTVRCSRFLARSQSGHS